MIGAFFLLVGSGLLAFFAAIIWPMREWPGAWPMLAMVGLLFGSIALVGLSMVIQGARLGRMDSDGLQIVRALRSLARRG